LSLADSSVSAAPLSQTSAFVPSDPEEDNPNPSEKSQTQSAPIPVSPVVEYTIQPEDVLQITVYEEPDLLTKARVAMSGEIHFPLLGRVQVAGLSLMEAQEKIEELLEKDYLVNPQVQVFIETYHVRDVFVTGAVNQPGSYPLPAGKTTTLMEAIAMAGGFNEEAAVNSTRIIRIEEGREKTIHVKVNDIIKKGDKAKDVEVRPNDVIFVPESFF
jgi:polysaccharide export outer membrane protein